MLSNSTAFHIAKALSGSTHLCNTMLLLLSFQYESEMGGLGAETLGTETFLVSVAVSVPPRLKMYDLVKASVSRDFIIKSR